ncbi:MAG: 4a-hydroxytetrahydrobiopterin dehydratase [Coxiella sp. RIFCSPHIGHO2_12_FULL_44_14]|nr:MAG: 4a-hydroxytetrahydrobiopterin dehydratase [Coxiella sp. RIFCSPHIGHO2_12_FULL_44_14]
MKQDSLDQQHCTPCEGGIPPLDAQATASLLIQVPGWVLDSTHTTLHREFQFKNFFHTMSFVNAIAHVANQENHHPDLKLGYNYCIIEYSTHAIHGLSLNDFICAKKINALLEIV